jgi:selenium metabolism protein YedF
LITLDCRHAQCPTSVVETRKALLQNAGQAVSVLVGDETARDNISRMASGKGYTVTVTVSEGGYELLLAPPAHPAVQVAAEKPDGPTVVLIATDTLGQGNDELGTVLMRNFIITLRELNPPPSQIFFMNGGVKLTVAGSDALEALNQLACSGVDIATCGLCLDFFDLKEQLAVGRVGNMLETIEAMNGAARVIRP